MVFGFSAGPPQKYEFDQHADRERLAYSSKGQLCSTCRLLNAESDLNLET